jgi:hypothetical protein
MKKLFMTSGVILCMACPAFAAHDITPQGKDAENTTVDANCTNTYLDSYTGPVSLEAKWNPNMGTITLDSKRYTSASDGTGTAATTAATPTPLYSVYGVGVYDTSAHAAGYADATANPRMTSLTATPTLTGYDFGGFYATKAGALAGTAAEQVINSSGQFQYDAASTQVTAASGSTTWYARWTAHEYTISYSCGTNPSTNAAMTGDAPSQQTVAYDGTYTLSASYNTCAAPQGWHFGGWSCNYNLASGANTSTTYASAFANDAWTVDNTQAPATGTFKATNAVTCTAIWTANTIQLNWNSNGGSAITDGGADCTYGGGITLPTAPTRNGYTFTGWTVTNSGN